MLNEQVSRQRTNLEMPATRRNPVRVAFEQQGAARPVEQSFARRLVALCAHCGVTQCRAYFKALNRCRDSRCAASY